MRSAIPVWMVAAMLVSACGTTAATSGSTDDTAVADVAADDTNTATDTAGTDVAATDVTNSDTAISETPVADAPVADESATDAATVDATVVDTQMAQDVATTDTGPTVCTLTTSPKNGMGFGVPELTKNKDVSIKGVEVEAVPCGKVANGDDGTGHLKPAHPDVPFYYKLTEATHLTTLTMEFQIPLSQGGSFGQSFIALPATADVATLLPDHDATKASALIHISYASTACGMGGFTVTIDGHPEAKVTYWTAGGQSAAQPDKTLASAPGKNSEGIISVTGINPAAPTPFKINVIGAPGCTFSTDGLMPDGRTGKVPFEAGAVSCVELRG